MRNLPLFRRISPAASAMIRLAAGAALRGAGPRPLQHDSRDRPAARRRGNRLDTMEWMDGGTARWWFWMAVTRFGEAQILLPAFLAALLWLVAVRGPEAGLAHPGRAAAGRWAAGVAVATTVTTASKLAFIGWGYGVAALDFTGFSGHAMFSASLLPMLAALVLGRTGALAGSLLAALVMVSRVHVGAHSWSEALSGAALGAAVAAYTVRPWLRAEGVRPPLWLPLALLAWLTVLPLHAPPARTHEGVQRLALWLSGHPHPYTRHQMHHDARRAAEGLVVPAPAALDGVAGVPAPR